ncbi:MAG: putative acyltransferase [Segetibacter sp.]|nr:putative acyltransferase [Segetibacter sp.]
MSVIEKQALGIQNVANSNYLTYLNGLRALAAVYVLVHHGFFHFATPAGSFAYYMALVFKRGHSAVNLFIIISGFCLMLPLLRNNGKIEGGVGRFFKKRARRILPPFYITLIISILLHVAFLHRKTGTQWDGTFPFTSFDVFSMLFLFQDVFERTQSKINYSLWSVSVECHIYLLFPLLVLTWKKLGSILTAILTIIVALIIWLLILPVEGLNISRSGINPQYLCLFTFGFLTAYFSYSNDERAERFRKIHFAKIIIAAVLIFVFFSALFVAFRRFSPLPPHALRDLKEGMIISVVVFAIATGRMKRTLAFLSWKPLVSIGLFSYSIYLMHAPLLQLFTQYIVQPLQLSAVSASFALVFVGTPLTVLFSYLFYLAFERPFMTSRHDDKKFEKGRKKLFNAA